MDTKVLGDIILSSLNVKNAFDELLASVSNIELPDNLKEFSQFQQLGRSIAIQALYENIAKKTEDIVVLEKVKSLMSILGIEGANEFKPETYTDYMFPLICNLEKLKNKKSTPIDQFVDEVAKVLANSNSSLEHTSLEKIDRLAKLVEKSSEVYYNIATTERLERKEFNLYLLGIGNRLLQGIETAINSIVNIPDSKDYCTSLNSITGTLKKILEVKGISTFFGKKFSGLIKKQQELVSSIKKVDQFLNCDFLNLNIKKQEFLIYKGLNAFLNNNLRVSGKEIFKCYCQIRCLMLNKTATVYFKGKINGHYIEFKTNLSARTKGFTIESEDEGLTLLTMFDLMLSNIANDSFYNPNIKLQLETNCKQIYTRDPTNRNEWFCFCIQLLNYISFCETPSSSENLDLQLKKIKELSEKLINIKKIDDIFTKYLIQEVSSNLFEHFTSKNVIISMPAQTKLNGEESIEKLSSFSTEINKYGVYLNELRNFYDAFVATIGCFSSGFIPNKTMTFFVENIENKKILLERQLNVIETAMQKKLNVLTEKRVSTIVSYFKLMDQKLDVLKEEKELKGEEEKLLAEKIGTTITHFRFGECCPYDMFFSNSKRIYCFSTQYVELYKRVQQKFPNLSLDIPKNWEKILKEVFLNKELPFNHILIFIVGSVYQQQGNNQKALTFYSYCLEQKFWEDPKISNHMILITKEIIEGRIAHCHKMSLAKNFPEKEFFSSQAVVPGVFGKEVTDPSLPLVRASYGLSLKN
jgi:hypothetical protein